MFTIPHQLTLKYLTFDCYGTLIDWKTGIETNFKKCFLPGGKRSVSKKSIFQTYVTLEAKEEASYKPYKEILAETSTKLAAKIGYRQSEASAMKFAESITKWPAFPDTASTLRELGSLGFMRTILSNIDGTLLEETISNSHLAVDNFITAQDVKSYKPNKNHWFEFFRLTGAQKQEVIHVANSIYHDIIPANELGLKTVWVNRYKEEKPENVEPSFAVSNLSELVPLLENRQLS